MDINEDTLIKCIVDAKHIKDNVRLAYDLMKRYGLQGTYEDYEEEIN